MRIVHVFWSLTFGGIETMLVNIANAQAKLGADVFLMIINDAWDESLLKTILPDVHKVFIHRKYRSKGINFIFRYNKVLKQLNPDIIHLHDPHLYGIIFNQHLKEKTCVTLHDTPYGRVSISHIVRFLFPFCDFKLKGNVAYLDCIHPTFSISNSVAQKLQNIYNIESTVVNNGIITSDFKTRDSINTCADRLRLVQVSRIEHQKKGQDLIIKAVAEMNGEVEIDFIGVGSSMNYLKSLVTELGINDYVHFLGKKSQEYIKNNLYKYDLFVQPSRYEGFGLTVAEAMAAEVPVLVSSGQGPTEITCGNKYGWIFENENINDLICKLHYIHKNYNKALEKAKQARLYVREKYDVSVTANKYIVEYKNMIAK